MKRIANTLLAGMIALSACTEMEWQDPCTAIPESEDGIFAGMITGYSYGGNTDTRMGIGQDTQTGWPCYWDKGDALGVRTAKNVTVGTATLVSGEGTSCGKFAFSVNNPQEEGSAVRLVFPKSNLSHFTSAVLASEQVQEGGKSCVCNISDYSFAVADLKYTATDFPVDFKLTHALAYVCLKISSSAEDFGGATLNAASICASKVLSGPYQVDYNTLEVSAGAGNKYARVNFNTSVMLNDAVKTIWIAVIPQDLSGTTVTVSLEGEYYGNPVTIPVTVEGINLRGGTANVIDLTGLNDKKVARWYCPVDSRKRTGLGYAYGPANTFLIQCKDGATYKGGTYCPVDEYPQSVTFDFKARGDISKVGDPKNYYFGWATKNYTASSSPTASNVYCTRTTEFTNSDIDPKGYAFSVDRENYTVTVTNNSAHAGSPILIMTDESGRIVWGWAFWNIAADGTRLQAVKVSGGYGDFYLANMDIGQPTVDYAAFAANKVELSGGTCIDQVGRFIHKYQWGRYLPTFFNSYSSLCWSDGTAPTGNIPAVKGPVSLETALRYPYGLILPAKAGTEGRIPDWLSPSDGDLWGDLADSYTVVGTKSIYDPCPKGWRVPDGWTMAKWREYAVREPITYIADKGQIGVIAGGTYFAFSGVYENGITFSDSRDKAAMNGMSIYGNQTVCYWWGAHNYRDTGTPMTYSSNGKSTTSNPLLTMCGKASAGEDWYHSDYDYSQRTRGFSVRCMPDRYNR